MKPNPLTALEEIQRRKPGLHRSLLRLIYSLRSDLREERREERRKAAGKAKP